MLSPSKRKIFKRRKYEEEQGSKIRMVCNQSDQGYLGTMLMLETRVLGITSNLSEQLTLSIQETTDVIQDAE